MTAEEWGAFAAASARQPYDWFEAARDLRYVADQLWPPVAAFFVRADAFTEAHPGVVSPELMLAARAPLRFTGPYVLLAGLAIENLAKGLVVQREDPRVRGGLARWFTTHNVTRLLHRADVVLSSDELLLCSVLQAFVAWAGRYPVSVRFSEYGPQLTPGGAFIARSGYFRPENKATVDTLFERLWKIGTERDPALETLMSFPFAQDER